MATLPIKTLTVTAFRGDQESHESLTLTDNLSSGGTQSIWLDTYGRATSILGFAKRNTSAITSAVGAAAMRLRALYHYAKRDASGTVTRQELGLFDTGAGGLHYELRSSTDLGATWILIDDFGSSYVDRLPDFAQLGNLLVLTFGYGPAYQWDGTTLSEASTSRLAAPTITAGAAGNLEGTYRFRVRPVKADGTRKPASAASTPISLQKTQAAVAWTADTDTLVIGYDVYRTFGTGAVYFFEGSVAGRTTVSFTSALADSRLFANAVLQDHGDTPPAGFYFVEGHADRMFYGRTDAFPRRWYWGDPGLPLSLNPDENFYDMTDHESASDISTGGTGGYKGMFIAWLERSVWTISGTGAYGGGVVIDLQRRRTNARTGTVSHRTVARIPQGSAFIDHDGASIKFNEVVLAYLTPQKDIRAFDGNNDYIISHAKERTLKRMTYSARHKAFCYDDTERSVATWVFPIDGALEPNYQVSWNYEHGTWTESPYGFACVTEVDSATESNVLLAGEGNLATGGFCYRLWEGFTRDGVAIGAQVMTKTFYAQSRDGQPMPQFTCRWRWCELLLRASGPVTLLVEWFRGERPDDATNEDGSVQLTIPGVALQTTTGTAIQTTSGTAIHASVDPAFTRARLKNTTGQYLHARGVRFRISTVTNTTVQWAVAGMIIGYQILPGLKREFVR